MNVSRLSVVGDDSLPLVETDSLSKNPLFQQALKSQYPYRNSVDTFWRFPQDNEVIATAATAVGKLMFGVITSTPELSRLDLGTVSASYLIGKDDSWRRVGALVISTPYGVPDPRKEIIEPLVRGTNEFLVNLNSPYQLPWEQSAP